MGWQTLALYGIGAVSIVGIIYVLFRTWRKDSQQIGADSEAKKNLEEIIKVQKVRDRMDSGPLPLSEREQLKRLRILLKKADRRRS